MADAIFEIRESTEEDRPDLVSKHKPGLDDESRVNYRLVRGARKDVDSWTRWDLYCRQRGRTPIEEWDYYGFSSTSGLFSERAIETLKAYLEPRFVPLPALLEGITYYFLHCASTIDCLDVSRSDIEYFPPPDDEDIMDITKWRFAKDKVADPAIFAIPQVPLILLTSESLPGVARRANLRGINFALLDGPDST